MRLLSQPYILHKPLLQEVVFYLDTIAKNNNAPMNGLFVARHPYHAVPSRNGNLTPRIRHWHWMQGVSIWFAWRFEKSCIHLTGDELFFGMPGESKGCGMRRMSMPDPGRLFLRENL